MAATLKLGDRKWATKEGSLLAYNDENNNYKPLPFDFTRASSATRVNKQGLIETVASGVPRIDFTDANGALLLEPQRTNLVGYSEDFSQWFQIGTATITSNYGVSPDGTQNSSRLQMNASDKIYITVASSGDISFTVYLKGVGQIRLRDNTSTGLKDVTLTSEWVRYELNFNATISNFQIEQQTGVSDLEIYGAQLEQGSYATSYIPTQGSAVTRIADACTGAGNDQVINSAEGVFYFEGSALANDGTNRFLSIDDGTTSNYIYFRYVSTSNNVLFRTTVAGVTINTLQTSLPDTAQNHKFAFKWKSGDYAFWIDGVEVGTDTSASVFSANTLNNIGMNFPSSTGGFYANIKELQVFTTALTDAELIALTTI
jgi:hypothetical protein